jgi:hypothetical protein
MAQIYLKTILTLELRLSDDLTCSVMKGTRSIAFMKMDVELAGETIFLDLDMENGIKRVFIPPQFFKSTPTLGSLCNWTDKAYDDAGEQER